MENIEREKRFVILGKASNGGGGGGEGTVTSVGISVPTGLTVTGSPITSSGTLQIGFANGYSIPTTTKQAEWDAKSDFSGSYNDLTDKPTIPTIDVTASGNNTFTGSNTFTNGLTFGSSNNQLRISLIPESEGGGSQILSDNTLRIHSNGDLYIGTPNGGVTINGNEVMTRNYFSTETLTFVDENNVSTTLNVYIEPIEP